MENRGTLKYKVMFVILAALVGTRELTKYYSANMLAFDFGIFLQSISTFVNRGGLFLQHGRVGVLQHDDHVWSPLLPSPAGFHTGIQALAAPPLTAGLTVLVLSSRCLRSSTLG